MCGTDAKCKNLFPTDIYVKHMNLLLSERNAILLFFPPS